MTQFVREIASADASATRDQFEKFAAEHADSHLKSHGAIHFTASGFVIDSSGEFIALHLHKKVGAWLQFGGHIEPGETSFEAAARREVLEESGLCEIELVGTSPVHLHPHTLNSNFTQCSEHWDVQYLFRTPFVPVHPGDGLTVSSESGALQWFRINDLPEDVIDDVHSTVAGPITTRILEYGARAS